MKAMKKVFAILVVVAMVMGLSVTAFAADAGTYTITINDAVSGETYNAYKIFDATQSTSTSYVVDDNGTYYYDTDSGEYTEEQPSNYQKNDNDEAVMYKQVTSEHYSYTISSGSAWFNDVLTYMGGGTDAATADAKGVYTGAGLTLTPSGADKTVYVVKATVLGEGETAVEGTTYFSVAEFAAFLNTKTTGKTADATQKASSTTVTLDVSTSEAGYYFVDTSLGSLCSLDSVVGTAQVIYEKNAVPSITKYVLDDDDNSTHVLNTTEDWNNWEKQEYAVLDVIDTVYYKLVVNTGSDDYSTTDGTGVDDNYVIVDTLPTGITYNKNAGTNKDEDTVVVKVGTGDPWTLDTDYTVSYDTENNKLTITLLATGALKNVGESTEITITYNASITAAETGGVKINDNNVNSATLTYKSQTSTSQANVKTYQLVNDANNDNKPDFQKVDGNGDALEGVTFVLSRDVKGTDDEGNETTTTEYAVVNTDGYLVEWNKTKVEASDVSTNTSYLVTDKNGVINVKGLDAGTYILTETDTLDGYNKLDYTITVTIDENGNVEYIKTGETKTQDGDYSTITVINNTGTELPSTGGIGTTIFYVVGSILVIGAAVLLITKKRMTNVQ